MGKQEATTAAREMLGFQGYSILSPSKEKIAYGGNRMPQGLLLHAQKALNGARMAAQILFEQEQYAAANDVIDGLMKTMQAIDRGSGFPVPSVGACTLEMDAAGHWLGALSSFLYVLAESTKEGDGPG